MPFSAIVYFLTRLTEKYKMSLKTKQTPTELDHIRDTLTNVVGVVGQTRQDVKKLDKKVDANHREICQRLDRQDYNIAEVKTDIVNMKTDITNMKTDITNIKTDITNMKADIAEVKVEIKAINNRFDQLELLIRQSLPTN